jgi:sigma54-dependent transcription regulator
MLRKRETWSRSYLVHLTTCTHQPVVALFLLLLRLFLSSIILIDSNESVSKLPMIAPT